MRMENKLSFLKPIIKFGGGGGGGEAGAGGALRLRRGRDGVLRRSFGNEGRELPRKPRRRCLPGGSAYSHPGPGHGAATLPEQGIALRGSAKIVAEFFQRLCKCSVQKLVVVFSNTESGEVLERWRFDVECDKTAKDSRAPREKSEEALQDEIRSEIRQTTATVTFLPLLEVSCSFELLIYTDRDLVVPEKWEVGTTVHYQF
ncbi:hypothetical protein G4228_011522 [Cervus hanglu yarkandensis]|nr:hypothetical protein G4228_011522 [Cervus hanglu yarkandensis]